jgi:hypothetical protein
MRNDDLIRHQKRRQRVRHVLVAFDLLILVLLLLGAWSALFGPG